jgi:hypothetical protein
MPTVIWGVVHEGRIVPGAPLPEGLHVQITFSEDLVIRSTSKPTWTPGHAEVPRPSPGSRNWPR